MIFSYVLVLFIMSMGILFEKLSPDVIRQVRSLEQANKRYINATAAVQFNEICLQNNMLPKFTKIRLHNEAVQSEGFTKNFRRL